MVLNMSGCIHSLVRVKLKYSVNPHRRASPGSLVNKSGFPSKSTDSKVPDSGFNIFPSLVSIATYNEFMLESPRKTRDSTGPMYCCSITEQDVGESVSEFVGCHTGTSAASVGESPPLSQTHSPWLSQTVRTVGTVGGIDKASGGGEDCVTVGNIDKAGGGGGEDFGSRP
jgi:hypothetical protein